MKTPHVKSLKLICMVMLTLTLGVLFTGEASAAGGTPVITDIEPDVRVYADPPAHTIEIYGTDLLPIDTSSCIIFEGDSYSVSFRGTPTGTTWTDDLIRFTLPVMPVGEYQVHIVNSGGTSNSVSFRVSPLDLPMPRLLSVTVDSYAVALRWEDNSWEGSGNEIEFRIYRILTSQEPNYTLIATLPPDTTYYVDNTVDPGTAYGYMICAVYPGGGISYYDYVDIFTVTVPAYIAAPTNFTAYAVSETETALSWTDNSYNESEFMIEFCTFDFYGGGGFSVDEDVEYYNHTSLDSGTRYFYRIRASDGSGNYSDWAYAEAVTPFGQPYISYLESEKVLFSFRPSELIVINGYHFGRAYPHTSFVEFTAEDGTVVTIDGFHPWVVWEDGRISLRVPPFPIGQHSLKVITPGGESYSVYFEIIPYDYPEPINFSVSWTSHDTIFLTWEDDSWVGSGNETSFELARRVQGSGDDYSSTISLSSDTVYYEDTYLDPSTTYEYELFAVYDYGYEESTRVYTEGTTEPALPELPYIESLTPTFVPYADSPIHPLTIEGRDFTTSGDVEISDGQNVFTVSVYDSYTTWGVSDIQIAVPVMRATNYEVTVVTSVGRSNAVSFEVQPVIGEDPYVCEAIIDTYISQENPTTNYGSATPLIVDGSPSGSDLSILLKWDIESAGIPQDSPIIFANIDYMITDSPANSSRQAYQLYEIKQDWVEAEATWEASSTGNPWQLAGAQGPNDRGSTVIGETIISLEFMLGPQTITLNPDGLGLIESWLDNPLTNNGIIISSPDNSDSLKFNSREAAENYRPKLTIFTKVYPYLQDVTQNSIKVMWYSNTPSIGTVEYWLSGGPVLSVTEPEARSVHEVLIEG
ncbi:MAG: DNRLRE domain-containing protein, partial [Candidatus Omnitrophica bacterium]|nr:DNRLRE domain-containing protein [Candidatus Omnitrophota bacterium]